MDEKESKDGRGPVDRTGGIMADRLALSNITVRFSPECRSKIETFTKAMHHSVELFSSPFLPFSRLAGLLRIYSSSVRSVALKLKISAGAFVESCTAAIANKTVVKYLHV